jgi:hypothetical protein
MRARPASTPADARAISATTSADRRAFWKDVPAWARTAFLAGLVCSFSAVGFVGDILGRGTSPRWRLAFLVCSSGLAAVVYAVCAFLSLRLVAVAVVRHLSIIRLAGALGPSARVVLPLGRAGLEGLRARLALDGIGCAAAMALSYAFFVTFISTEGQRYLRVHTEMVLAGRIHRSLVPGGGRGSRPVRLPRPVVPLRAGGGDLVDLVRTPDGWTALVADVSGHGVPSEVLTAMVKSAVRMRLRAPTDASSLLVDLNEILVPMIEPNMFDTCTRLRGGSTGMVTVAAAGPPAGPARPPGDRRDRRAQYLEPGPRHPPGPVVHRHTDRHADRRRPAPADGWPARGVRSEGRRVRARRRRRGPAGARQQPLAAIAARIRAAARAHGTQMDDQTLLLIRAC